MTKILFLADTATFAHASRSMLLAHACAELGATTAIATGALPDILKNDIKIPHFNCTTTDPKAFTSRILWGLPPFSRSEISQGVVQELEIFKQFSPDIIISDLRVSTTISARMAGIPVIALTNSYWHDLEQGRLPEVPLLQMMKILGVKLSDRIASMAYPFSEKLILAPINSVRRAYGLPAITAFREVFLGGDAIAYCEPLFLPKKHKHLNVPDHYLGCVSWSARSSATTVFKEGRGIYLSLGSSGSFDALPKLIQCVEALNRPVILSLAGRRYSGKMPSMVQVANFVDPDRVLPSCDLAITNGGSPSSLQALSHGVPVVGITTNLDQILCMRRLSTYGAAVSARACDLKPDALLALCRTVLSETRYREKAKEFQSINSVLNPAKELFALIANVLRNAAPVAQ